MNSVKITLISALLLIIFSLPTLTATQLVGVLGESTEIASVRKIILGDSATYIRQEGDKLTVSYTKIGNHPVIRIINPNPVGKTVRINIAPGSDAALLSQVVEIDTATSGSFRLYDRAVIPFNPSYDLHLLAQEEVDLILQVTADEADQGYGTVSFELKEF